MFPLQDSPPPPSAFFGGEGSPSWCSGDRPPGHHGPVARRNERERKRVRLVNMGFAKLRQYIPSRGRPGKRLSKVETLRSAIDYIRQLRQLLRQPDPPYYFPPPPTQLLHQPQQRLAADYRCDFGCPCNDSPLPTDYVFETAPDYAMMAYPQDTYVM